MSKGIQWLNNRIKWHKDCLNGTPQKELIPKLKEDLQMLEDMRNQLQALEIIKKVVKYDIEVNGNTGIPKYEQNDVITQEEYELLKEVLL